jgi:hypothetical protein
MARKRIALRTGDLSPDEQIKGLKSSDLQKDMSEDEKMEAAIGGAKTMGEAYAGLAGKSKVTVGDVDAAVKRKQAKIASMRKARGQ